MRHKKISRGRLLTAMTGLYGSKAILRSIRHSVSWATPKEFYELLNKEFSFDFDPCPINPTVNGIFCDWGKRNFVNPPYNKAIIGWLNKALIEKEKGNMSVFLLPVRSDTIWFHDIVLKYACEIRFIQGRLYFGEKRTNPAPFPSMLVIFK